MAPYRKDQIGKFAWSWAETCDPTQITIENVHAAYRILLPKCKVGSCRRNCKGNPHCLSSLGEERWLSCLDDTQSSKLDPEGDRRLPNTFVGLKNLGATCYVNSLLQLWFHNSNFRKAIFLWNPLEDPVEQTNHTLHTEQYQPLTVIGHLQCLFALMQYGNTKYIDPTDLIQCLRLDANIQQDAQEFSKLFLSVLDSNLQRQSTKEVKEMIKDTFCGEYTYTTRCLKCYTESRCPSTFYELDLHIRGHKTLQDSLREFMQMELLEGEDRYYCTVCKEKQNAHRFISLTLLPPVLNLQLMRFVFDKNLRFKKKLSTPVHFPEVLNMTEFLSSSDEEVEYTLSAVLIHIGRGANSGHYVAYMCDRGSSQWYKFNDELVEQVKQLKWVNDEDYEPDNPKKVKAPKVPKGYYQSLNAYTLVYTLSKPKNDIIKFCSTEPDVAILQSYLENYVDQKNNEFEEFVRQASLIDNVPERKYSQFEMASLVTMLPVKTDEKDFDAVSTSFLEDWMKKDSYDRPIDNEKITCLHGKLDLDSLIHTKYINSDAANRLYDVVGGGPRLRSDQFVCLTCVTNKCFMTRVKLKIGEESKEICYRMRNKFDENTSYWVGKASFRSWRRLVLDSLEDFIHAGGNVTDLNYLEDTITGYITNNNDKYEGIGIPNDKIPNENGDDTKILKKPPPSQKGTIINNEQESSHSDQMKFNEDLICLHGNLCIEENSRKLVPREVWSIFKKYFPSVRKFSSQDEHCSLCKSIASEDEVTKGMYKTEAQNQKQMLLDLYLDRNRSLLSHLEPAANATLHYVVNKEFMYEWRKFIKESGKRDPPYCIKNQSTLLCADHLKLLYDVTGNTCEFQDRICLVRESEWKILSQTYKWDKTVTVSCQHDGTLVTNPEVCLPCMEIRRELERKAKYSYNNAKIYIQVLNNDEVESSNDEPVNKRARLQAGNATCGTNRYDPSISGDNMGGVYNNLIQPRRSCRCRRKNGIKELTVSSDMNLLDIKKKICTTINVAPMDQHLSTRDGFNLIENTITLSELGILPGTVLNLKVDEPCDGDVADEYLHQSREPEAGFKGTGLVGC